MNKRQRRAVVTARRIECLVAQNKRLSKYHIDDVGNKVKVSVLRRDSTSPVFMFYFALNRYLGFCRSYDSLNTRLNRPKGNTFVNYDTIKLKLKALSTDVSDWELILNERYSALLDYLGEPQ